MTREIVLDTETTGLDPARDRIVEIGAVELENHMPTGRTFHEYLDPQMAMPAEAFAVHGLGDEFLRGKPLFEEKADAFRAFVSGAALVIHNASFDMGFLNAEMERCGRGRLDDLKVIDTLGMARERYPGAQVSLDALCRRFGIDNSVREKHGALLDSELLAEVYLELIGGRQPGLVLGQAPSARGKAVEIDPTWRPRPRPVPLPARLTAEEAAAHDAFVEGLGADSVWRKYG